MKPSSRAVLNERKNELKLKLSIRRLSTLPSMPLSQKRVVVTDVFELGEVCQETLATEGEQAYLEEETAVGAMRKG